MLKEEAKKASETLLISGSFLSLPKAYLIGSSIHLHAWRHANTRELQNGLS
jgi:hypothetical protein